MATSVQLSITLSLLALSAILLSSVTSTRAAPVPTKHARQATVTANYTGNATSTINFQDDVLQILSTANYVNKTDLRDDLLTSENSDTTNFLRKICDVLAYSQLAAALHNNTANETLITSEGSGTAGSGAEVSFSNLMKKYHNILSTIITNTCKWAKQLSEMNSAELVANPPFDDNSCTGHITYLHRHCFVMRILSNGTTATSDAFGAARDYYTSLIQT